uniref:Uncharacterized protein n=3 Tax=Avena sativa TaxID=4498 RepID=A0ACD5V6B6_AVESA
MRPTTKPAATTPPSSAAGVKPRSSGIARLLQAPAVLALATVLAVNAPAPPQKVSEAAPKDTFRNVPGTLAGEDGKEAERIKHPRSPEAARCTSKCVSTCVLGGAGAPGIGGPFNVRRPLVVFKDGFRSRQYWYVQKSSRP